MEKVKKERRKCEIPGVRYLFALNGLLGCCTMYALRVNINVAIVAMVNQTAVHNSTEDSSTSEECTVSPPSFNLSNSTNNPTEEGEFIWSSKMQGLVLGAFYYGYCVSQIPGGRLAEIFGGKWVFGISSFITALLTFLTPVAARLGIEYLIAIRVLQGLMQGVTMPAISYMVGQWAPDSEKGFLNTLVHSGQNIGTTIAMPLVGFLCASDLFGGWPSAFYVTGLCGCLWFIIWCLSVTDTPLTHPLISNKELEYITSNQKIDGIELPAIPWKKILTSVPFWTVIICKTCHEWSDYTLTADLPTFFSTILHFPIEQNGFFSSFPYLLQTIVSIIVSYVADLTVRKQVASLGCVRKICNSVSGFGTALGLVGVCLSGCDATLNKFFFIFSIAIGGFCYSGFEMSLLDMSPEYLGTLMGLANTISNLTGFLGPFVVGVLTNEKNTLNQWRIVFGISSVLLTSSSFVFIFFSSSDKQDWAEQDSTDKVSDIPKEPAEKRSEYSPLN